MEDLFKGQLPDGESPDLHLYIFPHLQEFLTIDLRSGTPQVTLLNSTELFDGEFYRNVEEEFSHSLREKTDFPFDHLINLPLRLEEIIRGVAMASILERLGIDPEDEEQLPAVVVFIISGAALSMHWDQLMQNFRSLLQISEGKKANTRWESVFSRLASDENKAVKKLNQQELAEAMREDSPDYFTLWESRN